MRVVTVLVLMIMLLCGVMPAQGAEQVARFSGYKSAKTVDFEVKAPWLIDWRVTSDFPQSMVIEVSMYQGFNGDHEGKILKTKYIGNGAILFNKSGRFRFVVDSQFVNWDLRIKQLTPEEAALYTPRFED